MTSVTTDSIPPRDRAEFWADLLSRHVRPMRIEPAGESALRGEIEARPVGGLRIARVSGVGINALHTRAQVARGDGRLYGVCVSLEGDARLTRRSETIALGPGDIFITDSRQEFALDLVQPWRHLLITVPTGWLDSRVSRPERLAGAVLGTHPLGRLWSRHLAAGFAFAGELSSAAATLFARQSLDLLVLPSHEATANLGQGRDDQRRGHSMPQEDSDSSRGMWAPRRRIATPRAQSAAASD